MLITKILCYVLILLCGGFNTVTFDNIADSFTMATEMVVTINNTETKLSKGDEKFEKILNGLEKVTSNSREMPAFGVSLDKQTKEEMNKGVWLELCFNKVYYSNDLPFEGLLIKVEKGHQGFNLIRRTNGKYEGRCFYLDLEGDMTALVEAIEQTSLNNKTKD